jgi:hypothetical protein
MVSRAKIMKKTDYDKLCGKKERRMNVNDGEYGLKNK